jgi:hypothetical protein
MRGRFAFALATAATAWCVFLIAAAFFFPAYSGRECRVTPGEPSHCVNKSATDFESNGQRVISLFAGVAIVSFLVLLALHRVCATGSDLATGAAWGGILLLFAFSYTAGLSIGVLVLPAVGLLALSAVLTPKPARAAF